jgi:hypothetical protein
MKAFKSLISIITSSILVISTIGVAGAFSRDFSDVDESHTNQKAIRYLKEQGVVKGYDDGGFHPENEINRAEFLKVIMEAKGLDAAERSHCFDDVTDQWFAPYICAALDLGLIAGYDDGTFRPERSINFAEASKIITEAFILSVNDDNDENWYHQYVSALETLLAIPSSIDSFEKNVTRGEMAEMIWRINEPRTDHTDVIDYHGIKDRIFSVDSIKVWYDKDSKIIWEVDGASKEGYKVVWSKNSLPTYPKRNDFDNSQYFDDPYGRHAFLRAFSGAGSYAVRVCEYRNGECGVYSNQIWVYLDNQTYEHEDTQTGVNSISLWEISDKEVKWNVDGHSDEGFKLVWSRDEFPQYPTRDGDQSFYYSDSEADYARLHTFDGDGLYHVRVCEYTDGKCGIYSNEITIELEEIIGDQDSEVKDLELTHAEGARVEWVADGYSDQGYKVIWSKNSFPEYPTRAGDKYLYFSDSSRDWADLTAFDGAGTYHVRVCEYLGSRCGQYSNPVAVELGKDDEEPGVTNIILSLDTNNRIQWEVEGYSDKGFKVVWSMNDKPQYPIRNGDKYQYFSSPDKELADLHAFDGTGVYHVRICEYLGDGVCGVYSNEVEINLIK